MNLRRLVHVKILTSDVSEETPIPAMMSGLVVETVMFIFSVLHTGLLYLFTVGEGNKIE